MLQIDTWKRVLIWLVCAAGVVLALPNLFYTRVEQSNDAVKLNIPRLVDGPHGALADLFENLEVPDRFPDERIPRRRSCARLVLGAGRIRLLLGRLTRRGGRDADALPTVRALDLLPGQLIGRTEDLVALRMSTCELYRHRRVTAGTSALWHRHHCP